MMGRKSLILGAVLLIAAFIRSANSSALDRGEAAPSAEGKIAFYSSRSGNAQIYVMNADGTGLQRLTTNSAKDRSPVISPDGRRIAFASERDGESRIYLMNVDGSGQRRLTASTDVEILPSWSPDGQRIYYQIEPPGGRSILCSARTDGSDVRRITDGSMGFNYPAVSPDGTKILCEGPGFTVWVMNIDGIGRRTIGTSGVSRLRPVWSPDGRKIAYGLLRGAPPNHTTEIGVMDAGGGHDTVITRDGTVNEFPCWSPDGRRIAFQSCRDGNFEIYVMNADGGDARRLTDDPKFDGAPSWGVVEENGGAAARKSAGKPARAAGAAGGGETPLTLTTVANMGVLVCSGDTKVLVDALFDKPNPEYRAPAPETLDQIMKGEAPFDGVDVVLVTHSHPDHFDAGLAVRYLESGNEPVLVAPEDAVEAMRRAAADWSRIEPRIVPIDLKVGETRRLDVGSVPVTACRTLHSGDRDDPMNIMYIFEIGGRRVWHEGDPNGRCEIFQAFGLKDARLDLAVVHYWYPLEPNCARFLQEDLKAGHIALGHLPIRLEGDAPGKIDMVRQYYKDIFLLLPGAPAKVMASESFQPQDILSAVKNGDLDRVRALLNQDPELIRAKDEYQNSLLRVALLNNDSMMARFLIESGIDLDYAREDIGGSEIFGAIDVGSFEITKLISEKGADIHSVRRWDNTPLEAAILGGHKEIAYFLMDKGAALDARGPKAPRFLRAALGAGMDRITNLLIKVKGVDFGDVNALGDTLLHAAARSGETVFIGLLVEKGLDPNARNVYGWTPLHTAASLGHRSMVETLVKNGADKRTRTKDGQTPLNLADALGHQELSVFLKKKGFPAAPPEYPKLSAPYIEPDLPGEEPSRFAPGIISQPHHFEHAKLSFTADMTMVCWADWQRTGTSKVFVMEKRDGLWQAPRTVLLNATMPFIEPDGKRIFFTAPRVLPDGREAGDSDIYYIQRTEAGWSDRIDLGPGVNTELDEIQPSVSRDGAVYFAHRADIYRSKVVDGRYAPKERLPAPINDDATQAQPFIAPDGSFLLFLSLGQGGVRDPNYYCASAGADGAWTEPVNIAKKVKRIGLFPSLTPDKKFMIYFEGGDYFWLDIGAVMEELTGSMKKQGDFR